jgi:hypothetical protein
MVITKDDIGKKVVSEFFGIGVITEVTEHEIPVGVMFNSIKWPFEYGMLKEHPDCYYYADGAFCVKNRSEAWDIRLLEPVEEKRSNLSALI